VWHIGRVIVAIHEVIVSVTDGTTFVTRLHNPMISNRRSHTCRAVRTCFDDINQEDHLDSNVSVAGIT
jgi:hypothetical protein